MKIGGLDIATVTGLCHCDGDTFVASTFKPKAKRPFELPKNEVSFEHEGRVAREFRDHLRPWLVENQIEVLGIEKPLPPNIQIRKTVIDMQANFAGQSMRVEEKGGTTFATIFRIYMLVGVACELAARLNIPVHLVEQGVWRQAFIEVRRAPKGVTDPEWLKKRARQRCNDMNIEVPNLDAAEAVGVTWWVRGMLFPEKARRANDLFRTEQVSA